MHPLKKLFQSATGYWIHKVQTLPTGTSIEVDINNQIGYPGIDLVFDVGANTGQTVEWLRSFVPEATIYSFEPIQSTFAELKGNVASQKKVILEQLAFGDIPGKKTIRLFDEYSSLNSLRDDLMNQNQSARTEVITITTIDQYCADKNIKKIDLLKIDTEGYEIEVLEGAKGMLSSGSISMVYCEVGFQQRNKRNTNFSVLSNWLEEKGFYFFGIYQLVSDGWSKGDYFGNALFVHKGLIK